MPAQVHSVQIKTVFLTVIPLHYFLPRCEGQKTYLHIYIYKCQTTKRCRILNTSIMIAILPSILASALIAASVREYQIQVKSHECSHCGTTVINERWGRAFMGTTRESNPLVLRINLASGGCMLLSCTRSLKISTCDQRKIFKVSPHSVGTLLSMCSPCKHEGKSCPTPAIESIQLDWNWLLVTNSNQVTKYSS